MVWTGLSEVIGSWKIIDILLPRSLRRSSADSVSTSRSAEQHRLGLDLARRARHQAHDRERRHALAAAGFADQADGAAARHAEADAVDGAEQAAIRREVGLETANLEECFHQNE